MTNIGLGSDIQEAVAEVLVALLHLGNIKFEQADGSDSARVVGMPQAESGADVQAPKGTKQAT